jgi:hypothetical protein
MLCNDNIYIYTNIYMCVYLFNHIKAATTTTMMCLMFITLILLVRYYYCGITIKCITFTGMMVSQCHHSKETTLHKLFMFPIDMVSSLLL